MEFSVCYEFAITRRMPWDEEPEVLREHIGHVRTGVSAHPAVEGLTVRTDLSRAQAVFEFSAFGHSRDTVEETVATLVAGAIRDAGAYHQGMMPKEVEVKMSPKLRPWSGLRTPSWRVKRSTLAFHRQNRGYSGGAEAAAV